MEAALVTPGLEAAQCLRLHLAIGKAADDLGDCAMAMQHFDAADAVRRGLAPFDSGAFSIEVDRLIGHYTRELMARAPELGSRAAMPVLIIGMPRSGTTLVEQIVSMHPEVGAGGELNFWIERGAAGRSSGAAGNETPFLARAAADYLRVLRAIAPKAARVTDKMPFNFLWAGLIHLTFPRAVIIHCPARRSRHGAVDPSNSLPPGLCVSDGRRRTGCVFPWLPAAHQPLAGRTAGGSLHRGRLRRPDVRARTGHPADHRSLRAAVARRVPSPRMQSAAHKDPQHVADSPADLSHLGRALAPLRAVARAPVRAH